MEKIRTVRLTPYLKGKGPTFTLHLFDTYKPHPRFAMRSMLAYELREGSEVIFSGDEFSPSPGYADDGDDTVRACLSFLTLRPGDVESEYFADYSPRQLQFRDEHAEALAMESLARFGEDR